MLVKLTYYAGSTARFFYPIMLKLCLFFKIPLQTFFQYYVPPKIGKTIRKVSFINLFYYYCSPDFVCCFSGFQYRPVSSNVSSFESLQDLNTILSRSHTYKSGTGNKVFWTCGSGSSPQKG